MKIAIILSLLATMAIAENIECKTIYLDDYIAIKKIPLNKNIFSISSTIKPVLGDNIFLQKNYGINNNEYEAINDLHYYLSSKDKAGYCTDLKTRDNYQSFLILEALHIVLVSKAIKTQNLDIAKKLLNEYDLVGGSLSEGGVYEITIPLLLHIKNSNKLFLGDEKTTNTIANNIFGWIEANNFLLATGMAGSDYVQYRRGIKIYYTLAPIKTNEISPNKIISYSKFIEILKKKKLGAIADKIESQLYMTFQSAK